jgi:hypothetical protein
VSRRHDIAAAIAERQLEAVSGLRRCELAQILGASVEALVMGSDQRPYLATTTVIRRELGAVGVHVCVSTGGWDHGREAVVVRTVVVPPDPPLSRPQPRLARTMPGRRGPRHGRGSLLMRVRSWYLRRW